MAHGHPPGSVPEGPPGEHGMYAFGTTLEEAVSRLVERVRDSSNARA